MEVVPSLTFVPSKRTDYLLSAFVEEEIGLADRLWVQTDHSIKSGSTR
jgi:hypothetical protein